MGRLDAIKFCFLPTQDIPVNKKNSGFTLIEIVMVLVLLGILAAVAAPKYFDLQEQAEQNAALKRAEKAEARLATVQQELSGLKRHISNMTQAIFGKFYLNL